jgi:solute carrier family 10 (sodium/bile acid cotransporter), member 7
MKSLLPDRFVVLLIGMILLAWFLPGIEKVLPLQAISTYGISGIFFLYGLRLNPRLMMAGIANWKLHALVQSATFILFPLLVLAVLPGMHSSEQFALWLAVFYLAALPSTVSSSVVMVSIAGGNIPGAIFNASISGLIGILVTPLWMGLFMATGNGEFQLDQVFLELVLKILLPVFIGMALHRFWGSFAERYKKQLGIYDKTLILIIVYKSFSSSFSEGVFDSVKTMDLVLVAGGVVMLFFLVYMLTNNISKRLGFNREDRITATFCGSKKSLVHGSVFSDVLFSGMGNAGIFLVPLMIYHAFQLLVISIIAQKMHHKSITSK